MFYVLLLGVFLIVLAGVVKIFDGYSEFPDYSFWIGFIFLVVCGIGIGIAQIDGPVDVESYKIKKEQVEYTVKNVEDYDSDFMAKLYDDIMWYNSLVTKKQDRLTKTAYKWFVCEEWNELELIDYKLLPMNATVRAKILTDN